MTEQADVVWTTTTKLDVKIEGRIILTENELTIDVIEESMDDMDEKDRKYAKKFMNVFLPYKVDIKDIRKVKRGAKKIVLVTGFFKRCTIGIPEPELSQLESELNRLIK